MFLSPLEQFQIYPLISIQLGTLDLSFTNSSFIICFGIFSFLFCLDIILFSSKQIYIISKSWQRVIEILYLVLVSLLIENIGKKGQKFFPFIFQ